MTTFQTRLTLISKILTVMVCSALTGYVLYLVMAHYQAQAELQESQRRQFVKDLEQRASNAGVFLRAQTDNLRELSESREIAIYFENRSLGMSLEYGLNASLAAIEDLFAKFIQKNHFNRESVYTQVLFLTPGGRILAKSGGSCATGTDWARFVRHDIQPYFLTDRKGEECRIIVSYPCQFKGKLVGQVIGSISLPRVSGIFLENKKVSDGLNALVMGEHYLFMPAELKKILPASLQHGPPSFKSGMLTPFTVPGPEKINFLTVKSDISGTPFSIIQFIPAKKFDTERPYRILLATTVMALVILTALFLLFLLTARNSILKIRLDESALREQEAEKQKQLLQAEVSERKIAEQRLNLALKGGALGLWDWDIKTGHVDFNDRWAEMLGYSLQDLEKNFTAFEQLTHPDDRGFVKEAVEGHLANPAGLFEIEIRLLASSGEWRWILSKGMIVGFDSDGSPRRMAGTHLDITNRKMAETALREQSESLELLTRTLEQRVEQEIASRREKELMVLQSEKLASLGQLAAGVAHEINNPMGFITSNLRLLGTYFSSMKRLIEAQRTALEQTAPRQSLQQLAVIEQEVDAAYVLGDGAELVRESLDGADRITRIVRDLVSFSRIDAPEHEAIDLTVCLESALNIVRNELKYVATVVNEAEALPPVACHPGQMNQVFVNLLVNAGQALAPQGVITLRSRHNADSVSVSVSDNGHGIPESLRDRIFEPFFTTKEVGKGTGLGLSISRDIVAKHGGEILVESSGLGTTFTVRLPRTHGESQV